MRQSRNFQLAKQQQARTHDNREQEEYPAPRQKKKPVWFLAVPAMKRC